MLSVSLTVATVVTAQSPDDETNRIEDDGGVPHKPTLDELVKSLERLERSYLPFHIKSMETFRMNPQLSPKERRSYSYSDGRSHQSEMEYGQKVLGVWMERGTQLVDNEAQSHSDHYHTPERQIHISKHFFFDESVQVHIRAEKYWPPMVWATPLRGLFPLCSYTKGKMLSEAIRGGEVTASLSWDGGDAVLEFEFGSPGIRSRFRLWLGGEHDWHPIKLQKFDVAQADVYGWEWEATKLTRENEVWRVAEGTVRNRDRVGQDLREKIAYAQDFVVLNASYGDAVDERIFTYEIPLDAEVSDFTKPQAAEAAAVERRAVEVKAITLDGTAIAGASVRFSMQNGQEVGNELTDSDGIARTNQATPEIWVSVAATGFRPTSFGLGPSVNAFQMLLAPISKGKAVDADGAGLADVWITSEELNFRSDGVPFIPSVPRQASAERENDFSDEEGTFVLGSELHGLRRPDEPVLLAAVDEFASKMCIKFVPANRLSEPLTLVLQPTCQVTTTCKFLGMQNITSVYADVENAEGQVVGSAYLKTRQEGDSTTAEFRLTLTPGDYFLTSRGSTYLPPFSIPITVEAGKETIDLGTTLIEPSGVLRLRGKPAPELAVMWRDGTEATLLDFRGQVIVLDFWGYWCQPCVNEMPQLMDLAERWKDEPVRWISIHNPTLSTFEELDQRLNTLKEQNWQGRGMEIPTVIDTAAEEGDRTGVTGSRYGVRLWPTHVIIDHQGNVVGPAAMNDLAAQVEALLGK